MVTVALPGLASLLNLGPDDWVRQRGGKTALHHGAALCHCLLLVL